MSRGAGCLGSLEACWWRVQIMIRGRPGGGWIHAGAAVCGLQRMVQAVHAGNGCRAVSTACQRAVAVPCAPVPANEGAGGRSWGRARYRAVVTQRAQLAAARDVPYVYVDASADSAPILTRLGLHAVTTTTPYVWSP